MTSPDQENGDVLKPDALGHTLDLHKKVLAIKFNDETVDTEKIWRGLSYADDGDDDPNDFVCVQAGPKMGLFISLLVFFMRLNNETGVWWVTVKRFVL